jgi:repressor LexA
MREIGRAFGIASSSVYDHLEALTRKGVIRRSARSSRSIEILKHPEGATRRDAGIPVVGRIAAGQPLLAEQHVDGYLSLEPADGDRARAYALRVVGDSMVGAGILPGDFVIARYQETANHGDIVVARLDDEATVKRLKRAGRKWVLYPENDAYAPIPVRGDSVRIQGKVISVYRPVASAR